MSLRVWLPLINDTHNQGLLNLPTPWDARSRDTGGKLGQYCYSDNAIYHIENEWLGNIWSLACWVKSSGWNQYNDIILCKNTSSSGAQFYLSIIGGTQLNIGCNAGSQTLTISNTFATNTWYHIASTYDGSTLKLYLNGNEVGTKAYVSTQKTGMNNLGIGCRSTNAAGTSATGGANKRTNDVRIYDHCLSPLEVKEISQGLVLHYPLNGYLGSAPNLLSKYVTPGQRSPGSTSTAGRTNYYGNYGIIIPATENADTYFRLFLNKQLESGKTYTISCNVSGLLSGSYYKFPLFAQNNIAMGTLDLNHNGLCSLTFTMNWTGTQTAVSKDGRNIYVCFLDDSARAIASGQGAITVTNFKMEEGSIATPFSPDFYDLGLDTTKITDESGFGYDGTVTGSLSYISSNDGRYGSFTQFNGGSYIHLTPPTAEIKTFSVWVNWDSIPSGQSVILVDNGSQMGLGLMSTGILCSTSGAGNSYTFSKSSLVANTWYHFVVVETGTTTRKLYINGVEQTPTSNTSNWTYSVNELQLGKRSTTSDGFVGKLSDFRAYATVLSEADIKTLYNTSLQVDNLGSMHSFEFIENNVNIIQQINTNMMVFKKYEGGLSAYTQSNCQASLTSDGFRVYRPPNLTVANNGNTMYGGIVFRNMKVYSIHPYDSVNDNIWGLQKGHKYLLRFHVKGKTSNSGGYQVTNQLGWGGGGVSPSPTVIASVGIPSNFNGEQDCFYLFQINDNIVKTCTTSYPSFVQGNDYLSYRDFGYIWSYGDTGALGTDIYFTNVQLYDVTNTITDNVLKTGVLNFGSYEEGVSQAYIQYQERLNANTFIEK